MSISGVEIKYEMYCPLIQSIEVLKLEKRLDDEMFYLRDCPPEYSTIPFDMEPVHLPKGSAVPLNTIKVSSPGTSIITNEKCTGWKS